jgi:hypothetical protein
LFGQEDNKLRYAAIASNRTDAADVVMDLPSADGRVR